MSEPSVEPAPARGATATGAPGYRVALILLGIVITPVVLSAPTLGNGLTLPRVISAVLVGALILLLLSATTLSIGAHARQPTYDIVRFPFGAQGAKAINVLLAVSLFGWTAVTANGFGVATQSLLEKWFGVTVALPVLVIIGCAICVAATAFGFDVLGRVAQIAVPIIVVLLAVLIVTALRSAYAAGDPSTPLTWGVAVSSVVGTAIVLVVTAADFGSFTRGRKQAVVAAVLAFGIAYPCLYIAGAFPSILTGESTLLGAMAVIGALIPATILLIVAAVTANAGNMFQGTLAISTLIGFLRKWQITVAIGIAAAVVGSFDVTVWLPGFLLFLGIAAPPVAGIYIADFFLNRRGGYDPAVLHHQPAIRVLTFAAWILGSGIGYLTAYTSITLTGISSIDSLLVAALLYALISAIRTRARSDSGSPTAPPSTDVQDIEPTRRRNSSV